ncbi:hypothetical protein M758_9G005300 [Ceratodon purpureus]|nr:hypothetical protein M758_9G005300 [Ceratodon purpureus]
MSFRRIVVIRLSLCGFAAEFHDYWQGGTSSSAEFRVLMFDS